MIEKSQFLASYGSSILFGAVLLEQIGLPFPAVPWMLMAGALSATPQFNLLLGIEVAAFACLIANAFWFYLGRLRGNQVLGLLCRISVEADSCVHRTLGAYTRLGSWGLILGKFVPGMSIIMPPLAGMTGTSIGRYLLFDGLGSLIYCGFFIFCGYFLSSQIAQMGLVIGRIRGGALGLLLGISGLYFAFKYWQRLRLLHELRMERITVQELYRKVAAGERPIILDLRSRAELELNPTIIRGAIHLELEGFAKRHHEFPHDRDIIMYCSCPNELTSARGALMLHRSGFMPVRPLQGGIEAWRRNNYPTETWSAATTATPDHIWGGSEPATADAPKRPVPVNNANQPTIISKGGPT